MCGLWVQMSRSSPVTSRERPLADEATLSGPFQVHSETLTVETDTRIHLVDLTDQVMALVRRIGIAEGVLNLFSLHTTCSVLVNESQSALLVDMKQFLEHVVARDAEWLHNDPDHSDCDRFNADAHLRALLLGPSVTLQVSGGEVVLGQWQRILVAELDGPRARSVRVMVMGTK
jgi:secondary thiamine-phosphate synthase enzyme